MKVIPFDYNNQEVRSLKNEETGEIFWVAKDICNALEYKDVSMTLSKLDDDEKLIQKIFVSGQNRDMSCINESGLYTLILRSNKPQAKKFKKWITSEVIPSIMKTGEYKTPDKENEDSTFKNKYIDLLEKQNSLLHSIRNESVKNNMPAFKNKASNRYTKEEDVLIIQMRNEGKTYKEIGERLKRTLQGVKSRCFLLRSISKQEG